MNLKMQLKEFSLVPKFMYGNPNEDCETVKIKKGLKCTNCLPSSRVNLLTRAGKKKQNGEGFDVYIIPHASDLSLWFPKKGEPARGVVASACANHSG